MQQLRPPSNDCAALAEASLNVKIEDNKIALKTKK
jgi:hypothetical protein